ncbi:unnamed protein product [Notodromas monacha]|uniref:Uncharacterized protein n=1 Tax=Notodromas monacha TaxID=399045 RepID=A0A7R9BVL9_9CRUS|nr:unnamed protein product [Notodromas monacha]CAG0921605.1 unnamed protein product [Notodromas monacha]
MKVSSGGIFDIFKFPNKDSTHPDDLHVGNRVRNRLNIFRQPVEFAIDIAIPFDVSNFGTGSLAHIPMLTMIVGLASFFLLLGVLATPFLALVDKKTKKWKRDINNDCNDDDGPETPAGLILGYLRKLRSLDVDDGFGFMGLSEDDDGYGNSSGDAEENLECRKYVICEVHRHFHVLPDWALKAVTVVGKRMRNMAKYKEAIQAGFELEDCWRTFHGCPKDLGQIVASLPMKIMRRR